MRPIRLPSLGSAASSGRANAVPAAPPVPLLGWGPPPVSATAPSPCPHRAAGLSQVPPAQSGAAGARTICCQCGLGAPSRAWSTGCGRGAVTSAGSREGGTACHVLQAAQGARLSPQRGRFALSGHRWHPSPVPKGPCVTVPSLSREQGGWRPRPDSPSCCWAAWGSCSRSVSATARGQLLLQPGQEGATLSSRR